jgi:hypothetical protein
MMGEFRGAMIVASGVRSTSMRAQRRPSNPC